MSAHDQLGRQAHDSDRNLRAAGLALGLGLAVLAAVLFFVADAVATKECLDTGYGLADSVSMTEEGCELTVRAADGTRSAVVPTLSEPLATAALVTAVGSAVPPVVCLWLVTRRRNG